MIKTRHPTTSLFIIFAGLGIGWADVSLQKAIEITIARNPSLKLAQSQVENSQAEFKVVRSLRYPQWSLRSVATRGNNPVYVFGALLEQQKFASSNFDLGALNSPDSLTNFKNAIDLGIPLFSGFDISNGEKVRKIQVNQAQKNYDGTLQEVQCRMVEAFLTRLKMQGNWEFIQERVQSAQVEVDAARRLNAKGLVLGSDYYAAQAMLSGFKAQATQAKKEAEAAQAVLEVMLGVSLGEKNQLQGRLDHPKYNVDEKTNFVDQALIHRHDFIQADFQISASEISLTQSRRSVLPRIEAFASLETNSKNFDSNPSNHMMGIRSHIPLGDPTYFSRLQQSKAHVEMAQHQKESLEEHIRIEVTQALRAYQAAVASLSLAQSAVDESTRSLQLFRPLYKEGRQSLLDVLRAEDGLLKAQQALNENEFQIHLGFARLQRHIGQFNTDVVSTIQAQLEKSR